MSQIKKRTNSAEKVGRRLCERHLVRRAKRSDPEADRRVQTREARGRARHARLSSRAPQKLCRPQSRTKRPSGQGTSGRSRRLRLECLALGWRGGQEEPERVVQVHWPRVWQGAPRPDQARGGRGEEWASEEAAGGAAGAETGN